MNPQTLTNSNCYCSESGRCNTKKLNTKSHYTSENQQTVVASSNHLENILG